MRIDLLLQREDFPDILVNTLVPFWNTAYGNDHAVNWVDFKRVPSPAVPREGTQLWLGNPFLNVFFTLPANQQAFGPVRNEFSQNRRQFISPFQRMYVNLALSNHGARYLSRLGLSVSPAIPQSENVLIIPGNRKIRLLNHETGSVYTLLKDGFPWHFFQREIESRQTAVQHNVPVPVIREMSSSGTWFEEAYTSGTPLNRLPGDEYREGMALSAAEIQPLLQATYQEVDLHAYIGERHRSIHSLLSHSHLLSPAQVARAARITDILVQSASKILSGKLLPTSLTHGDFQPGNLLRDQREVWIIDWEYSARRFSGYDALVLALQARQTNGLARRIQRFLSGENLFDSFPWLARWTGVDWKASSQRAFAIQLFFLDDLLLRLEENSIPCFHRLDPGFNALLSEAERWLGMTGR